MDFGGSTEARFGMIALDPLHLEADVTIEVGYEGASDRSAKVDALVLQPAIEYRVVEADDGIGTVLRGFVEEPRRETVSMPIRADWDVEVRCFDETGEMVRKATDRSRATRIAMSPSNRGDSQSHGPGRPIQRRRTTDNDYSRLLPPIAVNGDGDRR